MTMDVSLGNILLILTLLLGYGGSLVTDHFSSSQTAKDVAALSLSTSTKADLKTLSDTNVQQFSDLNRKVDKLTETISTLPVDRVQLAAVTSAVGELKTNVAAVNAAQDARLTAVEHKNIEFQGLLDYLKSAVAGLTAASGISPRGPR